MLLSTIKYNNKDKQINTAPNDVKTIVTSIDNINPNIKNQLANKYN